MAGAGFLTLGRRDLWEEICSRNNSRVPQRGEHRITMYLAILLLGIYQEELKTGTHICTSLFRAALLTIAMHGWINKMCIYTVEYYSALKRNEVLTCYNMDEP